VKFFFDRNISVHIARMIAHFERVHDVIHQDDDGRFHRSDLDPAIIARVGQDRPAPVWISADRAQNRIPAERAALRDSGMHCFFFRNLFGKTHQTPHFQALKVLSVWPKLVETAERAKVPSAFEIPCGRIANLHEKIDPLGATAQLFKDDQPSASSPPSGQSPSVSPGSGSSPAPSRP
jgi:PIN like domain